MFVGDGIPSGALHVVYGANEAGKSTALRAVSGLLFGIGTHTTDAFLHQMTDLRLGAVLEATDGSVMQVVRRKGKKNTLLDPAGNVLDEGVLRRLCGSATESTFRALFGLDHVSLREGAEALLAGQGDVGESLFEAALGGGGRGIHRVLQDLEAEADALFTPKAHKRKLNEAINSYQEARAAVRMKARSGEAWMKQKRGLDEAKVEHQRLAELLRARRRELHRLERARRLLPLGARRDRLLQRISALGEVMLLPADAGRAREAALADRQQAAAELARLEAEIAEITARRDGLSAPAWLDDPAVARLADLPDRLGAHRKAVEDRPRLVSVLASYQEQAERLAAEVRGKDHGRPARGADTDGAVSREREGRVIALGAAERARVRGLAHLEAALLQRQQQARRAREDLEQRARVRADELARLPPDADSGPLRRVLRRVEREGDLEGRRQTAVEEQQRLERELHRSILTLG
ncbi:MAG: AAA family ATPase, partial [Polyangia bacterium]